MALAVAGVLALSVLEALPVELLVWAAALPAVVLAVAAAGVVAAVAAAVVVAAVAEAAGVDAAGALLTVAGEAGDPAIVPKGVFLSAWVLTMGRWPGR